MGAGQIGGIATLLDMDFNNAAGFQGVPAKVTEAQYIVYYLSHAMLFCAGALIEAHIVLTPAICVFGERYKFKIYGGTHQFLDYAGVGRQVQHLCLHKGYNHTLRWEECSTDNLALLCLNDQFFFHQREPYTDYILNRVRYGVVTNVEDRQKDTTCRYYGWGSRRNGYLIPLLIYLFRMDVTILPAKQCAPIFSHYDKYLCIQQPKCKDDLGSVIVCSGFVQGMMISRLIDRPCGVGFVDLSRYNRFLTCGVDDSRDVIDHDEFMAFDFSTYKPLRATTVLTTPPTNVSEDIT